ncbi:MAG TPA: hypothetical protein VMR98_00920 [Candidatus Polarisedimenticolaceae bacterium]|nr:hypothetical protein [Candidatus Polarisedimenticolaceae bacterium]
MTVRGHVRLLNPLNVFSQSQAQGLMKTSREQAAITGWLQLGELQTIVTPALTAG